MQPAGRVLLDDEAQPAEERGVEMPTFGGYMLYSGAVLLPVFAIITLVFFR